MKIIIIMFVLAFAFVGIMKLTGCKTRPDPDNVNLIFYYGGTTASYVVNATSLDHDKRVVVYDVFVDIKSCTPEVGQPLEAAWTPIAQKHVDRLVTEGKIDAATGVVIMAGFRTVMAGVNLLENKHPEIRNDRDLLAAAVAGFTDGFLEHFIVDPQISKIVNNKDGGELVTIDQSVYEAVFHAAVQNNLR